MDRRSDRYNDSDENKKSTRSRVNKNRILYDEINNKIGIEEIPTYEQSEEINLSALDLDNLKRGDYQKVKDYKELIDESDDTPLEEKPVKEKKKKNYDINKVLEEAKKNREQDELEGKRSIKGEDYNILNSLNKKYLYQKGFSEEDTQELKELIDTITSKTMVDDIKDEEEKELLSELLATTIDIKLEKELSKTQIDQLAAQNIEEDSDDTNTFYSKSLEFTAGDLLKDNEKEEDINEQDEEKEEDEHNGAKVLFISLVLLLVIGIVIYFILQVVK